MSFATADLYDEYEEDLQIPGEMIRDEMASGDYMNLLKVFEDNSLVRAALEEPGLGKVLVVEGGGSLRCALLGDMLAGLGVKNGWAGVIVHGCIRDSVVIGKMNIGLKALNTNPRKSVKKGVGDRDVVVTFADVTINPGAYIYADEDGFVVAKRKLK